MIGLRLPTPPDPRALYAFDWLFSALGIRYETSEPHQGAPRVALSIHYGVAPEGPVSSRGLFSPCHFCAEGDATPEEHWIEYRGETLPVYDLAGSPEGEPLVRYRSGKAAIAKTERGLEFGFDPAASIFHLLTLGRENDTDRATSAPVVDYYIRLFAELLRVCLGDQPLVAKCPWPEGRPFAVFLSHDVDLVHRREPFTLAVDLYRILRSLIRGDWSAARGGCVSFYRALRSRDDPYWNFERWMEFEERHGIRSTFYFMEGRRLARYGRRYNVRRLAETIRRLLAGGWEIGLHGSYDAYLRTDRLLTERKKLEKHAGTRIRGHRQHYLRFDARDSYACYAGAGLTYDSTLGFNHRIGYRAGTSLPFRPYDPAAGGPSRLLEIPLVAMDQAVLVHGRPESEVQAALVEVAGSGGLYSILWHPHAFFQKSPLESALQYAIAHGAWFATGIQVDDWWRARQSCEIVTRYEPETGTLFIRIPAGFPAGLQLKIHAADGAEATLPCQCRTDVVAGMRVNVEIE